MKRTDATITITRNEFLTAAAKAIARLQEKIPVATLLTEELCLLNAILTRILFDEEEDDE